ncbi:hypothetical protein TPA0906_00340 [Streptomyces olivaceus]|uniref:hypothetical protein n=1 Tax=Streptomyces olivaceus TaxID=47716 RepID=UPI0022EEBFFC|nr:hypothetical protein [Streptomyces olivaceus]GHI98168.1 hypothetical protein TPA0906_00340 [Streptomyces olivaceus]
MFPGVFVATQATANAWRHLTAVARTFQRNPALEADRYARTIQQTATGGDAVKGGRGSEVALFGAQNLLQFEEEHGRYIEEAAPALAELVEGDRDVWAALEDLTRHDWTAFERKVGQFERASGMTLATLLSALSGAAAVLDPDGTLPTFTLDGTEAPPWSAKPQQVAEWRRQLVARLEAPETAEGTARELAEEHLSAIFPPEQFEGLDHVGRARLLCEQERDRLRGARMYFADADTTAVATRKASRPRKSPLDPQRVPSPCGFLVLDQPVDYAPGMAPLVAASWSVWQPPGRSEDAPTTWSLTLYAHTAATPPLAPVGFERITAGDVFAEGDEADEEADFASRAVVACWDLITQERVGKGVVDVAEEKRKPVKVRADRRRGITDDGTVRLVTIRGRRESVPRPRQERTDGAGPTRRYDRGRWWVEEHTRDHCMNSRLHRDGGCTHQDITVLEHPKGPADKPFLDTVYVVKAD